MVRKNLRLVSRVVAIITIVVFRIIEILLRAVFPIFALLLIEIGVAKVSFLVYVSYFCGKIILIWLR